MSEREKLKKLAEEANQSEWQLEYYSVSLKDNPDKEIFCSYSGRDLQFLYHCHPSTILALLSELEQAERERDSGERFRSQMQAALGCDTSGGKIWFGTGLLSRAETLVQREAALRTLREASAKISKAWMNGDIGCPESLDEAFENLGKE